MKTKNITLMFWVCVALAAAAMLEWVVFNRVAAASHKPNFSPLLWIVPLVSIPIPSLAAGIALWLEKSEQVRVFNLRWLAFLFGTVLAPILLTEDRVGLVWNLAVSAVALAIQLFGCFWFTKRLRLMRGAGGERSQFTPLHR